MANEVTITVTAEDHTDRVFRGIRNKAKASGRESADGFKSGFSGVFMRGANSFFGQLAENATGILGRAFGTATSSNPIIGTAIAAGIGASLMVALPAIGSAAAGALVLGFGGGIAGIGILAAAQSEKVKRSFSQTKDHVVAKVKEMAKPFEPVLVRISGMMRSTFDSFAPTLSRAMAAMAAPIERFASSVFTAMQQLKPAIMPVAEAFGALLDAIGPALPTMMEGIAEGIIAIADSISDNPQTFASLVGFMAAAAAAALKFVAALSRVANWFQSHPAVTGSLISGLLALAGPVRNAVTLFETIKSAWDRIKNLKATASIDIGRFAAGVAAAIARGAAFAKRVFTAVLSGNPGRLVAAVASAVSRGVGFARRVFTAALSGNFGRFAQAAAAAAARGAGFARRVFTAALSGNFGRFAQAVAAALARGAAFARRVFTGKLSANIGGVLSGVGRAISAAARWAGRVFTAVLRVKLPSMPKLPGFAHGGVTGAAGGGPRSGLTLVGEQGPELADLPTGTRVRSNPDTRRIMGGTGRGGPVVLEIRSGGSQLDDLLVELIRKAIRVRGGDVQLVLGT